MANLLPLRVTPFRNPSGTLAFRVSGTLRGARIRKNFKTEGEANAFVAARVVPQSRLSPRPVVTHLPEAQVRQAEVAAARLPPGTTLVQAADFFAQHHQPMRPLSAAEAVSEFGEWLRRQRKCEEYTVVSREGSLADFFRTAGIERSDRITPAAAEAWIYAREKSDRTQRDRFDILRRFCAWLVDKQHATINPVAKLDRPVAKVQTPRVLSFDEVWRLLQCAVTDAEGPDMLGYLAICALSGVREGEVRRLNGWQDVHLTPEHMLIEVNKAKGGRSRRNVPINGPLWRILTWCKAHHLPPHRFSKHKFNRIRERAKLRGVWQKDLLRHTYASHHYVVHKDPAALAHIMGNSERVLFQSYLRPVPLADGRRFEGLCLHFSAPREASRMGAGPKPRKPKR